MVYEITDGFKSYTVISVVRNTFGFFGTIGRVTLKNNNTGIRIKRYLFKSKLGEYIKMSRGRKYINKF